MKNFFNMLLVDFLKYQVYFKINICFKEFFDLQLMKILELRVQVEEIDYF